MAGIRSASVDVALQDLVAAALNRADAAEVPVDRPLEYDLGAVEGVGLAVTDAITLPDGRVLLSAAAEDTPNAVDDGPVVATAIALLDGGSVRAIAPVPEADGHVRKVGGLALPSVEGTTVRLLAVADDDRERPSAVLDLRAELARGPERRRPPPRGRPATGGAR